MNITCRMYLELSEVELLVVVSLVDFWAEVPPPPPIADDDCIFPASDDGDYGGDDDDDDCWVMIYSTSNFFFLQLFNSLKFHASINSSQLSTALHFIFHTFYIYLIFYSQYFLEFPLN